MAPLVGLSSLCTIPLVSEPLMALRPSSPNASSRTSTSVRVAPPEASFGCVNIPAGLDTTAKCSSSHSVFTFSPSAASTLPPFPFFFFFARLGFFARDRLSAPAARRAAVMRSSASPPAWTHAEMASEYDTTSGLTPASGMRTRTRSLAASCAPPRRSSALSATLNIPAARPLAEADGDDPPRAPPRAPCTSRASSSSSRPLAHEMILASAPASVASG
mmetsp:Transcript_13200/g.55798  ORF Transcript_13200/g.55798 Transcript_13200/m.55798 type:complete len:218 (-) Transcript_13200:320-973(-)